MTHLLPFAGAVVLFAASFAFQFLIMLLFRNPLRQGLFKRDGNTVFAATLSVSLIALSCAIMVDTAVQTVYVPVALGSAVVIGIIVPLAVWKLMRMRTRLDACGRGQSPFSSTSGASGAAGSGAVGTA